ncbi:hypothetical protein KC921_03965 [Candidatus Woesebacteria bacterium]|nr:hypothetical protein [Candidatus Woesebacteria bacterium]
MEDRLESATYKSRWPEQIVRGYKNLMAHGAPSGEFAQTLSQVELSEDDRTRLRFAGLNILWTGELRGFGYLSSSVDYDLCKENKAAAYIAECFAQKEHPAQPVVVSIDDFYVFLPGTPSLVTKTQIFDEVAAEQQPAVDFAIVLSDFTRSKLFSQEILEQIPSQDNAGMNPYHQTHFGISFLHSAETQLVPLLLKSEGDLSAVVSDIRTVTDCSEEDAKLFLVTNLLLKDRQMWQNLWYEGKAKGTPLYIVAPMSFHDAMNRLNLNWGHGGTDYNYRAKNSLGSNNNPPLDDGVEVSRYHEQGLSATAFSKRMQPILNAFATT